MKDKNTKKQRLAQVLGEDSFEIVSGGYKVTRDSETGEIKHLSCSDAEVDFLLGDLSWQNNLPDPSSGIRHQAALNAAVDWLRSHGFNEKYGSKER